MSEHLDMMYIRQPTEDSCQLRKFPSGRGSACNCLMASNRIPEDSQFLSKHL